jgi:ubiquinone biosynthesis protein
MFDWNSLLDESAIAGVLPGDYARFARPVRDALIVFLQGLPAAHQAGIILRQSSLPPSADISERLVSLAHCCPVLHKLGQVLARDERLAPSLRQRLHRLESLEPTVPLAAIQESVVGELGRLEELGIRLAPPAIAEASVAVVIPFVEPRHDRSGRLNEGVLKVLKPGIEERLALELELLTRVGAHLDERCEELQIPRLDYEDLFLQIREKLRNEVCLDGEQRHLAQASILFADDAKIHIPALREYCTPRITAMERIHGVKVTDHRLDSLRERRRLVETMVGALISRPIFSTTTQAMFHGDPHAGNLFFTDDGRLAILDWSLVGSLDDRQRIGLIQIMVAAVALDRGRIASVIESLSEPTALDRHALFSVIEQQLKRIRQGALPGLDWLIGLFDAVVLQAGVRLASDLMLFRKSLLTLEGVITEAGGGVIRPDEVLLGEFLRHFAWEWPRRLLAVPESREFATRLSNCDLLRSLLDIPVAAARYWTATAADMLHPIPSCISGPRPDCGAEAGPVCRSGADPARQAGSTCVRQASSKLHAQRGDRCDVANG